VTTKPQQAAAQQNLFDDRGEPSRTLHLLKTFQIFAFLIAKAAPGGNVHRPLKSFSAQNVPETGQNRRKPEKTCGNKLKRVDFLFGKAEGELRYGSPDPHEH